MRTLVSLVKAAAAGVFIGGMALAWSAPEATPWVDLHPAPAKAAPHWTPRIARHYPGCVDADDAGFVARWIVTSTRDGQRVMPMPYTDATVARIHASWTDADLANDQFTIGSCEVGVR